MYKFNDDTAKACVLILKIVKYFVITQEMVLDAVVKLQGSVTDDMKMSALLHESWANIDTYRSMLHELRYLEVCISLCHTLPLFTWH